MTNTVKIQSQILKNEVTNFSGGQISFDAKGQADVNLEDATSLLSVPDFTLVDEKDMDLVESADKQEILRKQPLSMYGKNVIVQLKKGTDEFNNLSGQLNTIGDSQYKFDTDGVAMMNTSAAQILKSVFPNITVSSVDAIEPEEEVIPAGTIKVTGSIEPEVEFIPITEEVVDEPVSLTEEVENDDDPEVINEEATETVVETEVKAPKSKGGRPKRQN